MNILQFVLIFVAVASLIIQIQAQSKPDWVDCPGKWEITGYTGYINQACDWCWGQYILGGNEKFGQKVKLRKEITNISPHYKIKIVMQVLVYDTWDNEQVNIFIDGKSAFNKSYNSQSFTPQSTNWRKCNEKVEGSKDQYDFLDTISFELDHANNSIVLEITTNLLNDAKISSFGISNIQIWTLDCHYSCQTCSGSTNQNCISCPQTSFRTNQPNDKGECPCLDKYYEDKGETICQMKQNGSDVQNLNYIVVQQSFSRWTICPDNWKIAGYNGSLEEVCAYCWEEFVLGGNEIFGKGVVLTKTFQSLPDHFKLKISFYAFIYDTWENEQILVYVDGVLKLAKKYNYNDFTGKFTNYRKCYHDEEDEYYDYRDKLTIEMDHQSSSVELIITTNLDQPANDESFGISNIDIGVASCHLSCNTCFGQKNNNCFTCKQQPNRAKVPNENNQCPCENDPDLEKAECLPSGPGQPGDL